MFETCTIRISDFYLRCLDQMNSFNLESMPPDDRPLGMDFDLNAMLLGVIADTYCRYLACPSFREQFGLSADADDVIGEFLRHEFAEFSDYMNDLPF